MLKNTEDFRGVAITFGDEIKDPLNEEVVRKTCRCEACVKRLLCRGQGEEGGSVTEKINGPLSRCDRPFIQVAESGTEFDRSKKQMLQI